jgi:hypothetical protein
VANLVRIYPNKTFLMWKPDMVLPLVNFVFCSQWLPPLSNNIWHCEVLEALLASAGEQRNTRQGDRAEQKRRDMEAAQPTIRYWLVMLDLPSDKQRRSYTTQKVKRGLA